jgi:hypothetical protein
MSAGVKLDVGTVLELSEADYMYGTGPLTIRLTEVKTDPSQFPAMEWVEVRGIDLYPDAEAERPRYVTIRVAAIKDALRPAQWRAPRCPPSRLPARRTTGVQHSPETTRPPPATRGHQ